MKKGAEAPLEFKRRGTRWLNQTEALRRRVMAATVAKPANISA